MRKRADVVLYIYGDYIPVGRDKQQKKVNKYIK